MTPKALISIPPHSAGGMDVSPPREIAMSAPEDPGKPVLKDSAKIEHILKSVPRDDHAPAGAVGIGVPKVHASRALDQPTPLLPKQSVPGLTLGGIAPSRKPFVRLGVNERPSQDHETPADAPKPKFKRLHQGSLHDRFNHKARPKI